MKKLVITGSTGMLGSNLAVAAQGRFDVYGLDLEAINPGIINQFAIDLTDPLEVARVIGQIDPDYVVHCAAMTNVDACETEPLKARSVNALATENLVRTLKPHVKLVYISTASVFDGERGGYAENDAPSPVNLYARTKLEGERFVESFQGGHLIIRTDIIGWNLVRGRSFIEWVFNSLAAGKRINMFTDVIFTPISVNTLSEYIFELLEQGVVGKFHAGVIEPISKYDLGIKLADSFGFDRALIQPAFLAGCALVARRPKDTSLDTRRAQGVLGQRPTIEEELGRLRKMKEAC